MIITEQNVCNQLPGTVIPLSTLNQVFSFSEMSVKVVKAIVK